MRSDAGTKDLLYAGSWITNDVYVFDRSGTQVGDLTGFDEPNGMCVDKRGDVYITNSGNGTLSEYSHGGVYPIKTFDPGGNPTGCSVDLSGDVAVNSFAKPAAVTIYALGDTSRGTTYQNLACATQWPMGYDDKGNLIGLGASGTLTACAVLAGAKTETTLALSGFSIRDPGSTMWDGKYIALTDSQVNAYGFQTGIVEATLVGKALVFHHETYLTTSNDYAFIPDPFIVGDQNTPASKHRGRTVLGPTASGSVYQIGFWPYPGGGNPARVISLGSDRIWGEAVSLLRK